jgi:Uma2 family endonuclease
MPVSEETYKRVALEDGDEQWELDRGHLRCMPPFTVAHAWAINELSRQLVFSLDERQYSGRVNGTRLRTSSGSYYVPDVLVVPRPLVERGLREHPHQLEAYDEPMPLVVEVSPPYHDDYDVDVKLAAYQQRGDAEIWRLHPYERTLIAWQRRPDGSYGEQQYTGVAVVEPVAVPGVRIELAALFE